jgi:hypothetical protein
VVWWRAGSWPYRRSVVLGGLAVLLVLLVAVPVGTVFSMSAGFGTRGDGNPESAVDSWLSSALSSSFDEPSRGNLARVTCNKPGGRQAGGRQAGGLTPGLPALAGQPSERLSRAAL